MSQIVNCHKFIQEIQILVCQRSTDSQAISYQVVPTGGPKTKNEKRQKKRFPFSVFGELPALSMKKTQSTAQVEPKCFFRPVRPCCGPKFKNQNQVNPRTISNLIRYHITLIIMSTSSASQQNCQQCVLQAREEEKRPSCLLPKQRRKFPVRHRLRIPVRYRERLPVLVRHLPGEDRRQVLAQVKGTGLPPIPTQSARGDGCRRVRLFRLKRR